MMIAKRLESDGNVPIDFSTHYVHLPTIFIYCLPSVYCQHLSDPAPPEMKRFLITLCIVIGANGGKVVNSDMWLKDVEDGKLPELTPDQQRYLFGGNIKIDDPMMSPAMRQISWHEAVEKGLLPPLSDDQQEYLFGGKVQLIEEPPFPPGQSNRRSENVETSFLHENLLSLKINEMFASQSEEQGRGRLKKIMVPVILAMTIIAAILLPALMTVIKLIAVKGLWSGVVSLIISKLLGLKALLNHHHHHHSEDNRRPYFVYIPNGKHRREEEENIQGQRQPYDQWLPENYEHWKRDGASTQMQ